MTRRAKLATIAILLLLSGIAIMFLFHTYGPVPSFMGQANFSGISPITGMGNGMGWMMLFGPLAMLLFFGGIVTLIVLLVTSLVQLLGKPD
ncbi:hypothetical protein [Agrobacterium sp. P15N1-A]|uniref:hypothetical protein n=1 Tax=Agrobacterium sp. P15N1-A TaxID=3342820 RepID=UPI0037DC5DFD